MATWMSQRASAWGGRDRQTHKKQTTLFTICAERLRKSRVEMEPGGRNSRRMKHQGKKANVNYPKEKVIRLMQCRQWRDRSSRGWSGGLGGIKKQPQKEHAHTEHYIGTNVVALLFRLLFLQYSLHMKWASEREWSWVLWCSCSKREQRRLLIRSSSLAGCNGGGGGRGQQQQQQRRCIQQGPASQLARS